jgi:cystathionine beta-lyase/cystathionine gamma-synthase
MKTLAVRMRFQNESALKIAGFLEGNPAVEKVNYPGLSSHRGNEFARKYLNGFSGMISFELKGNAADADRFINNITLPISAPSLGGVESLITRPVTTSHAGLSKQDLERLGISEKLVRFSVGLESPDEIIKDFDRTLKGFLK